MCHSRSARRGNTCGRANYCAPNKPRWKSCQSHYSAPIPVNELVDMMAVDIKEPQQLDTRKASEINEKEVLTDEAVDSTEEPPVYAAQPSHVGESECRHMNMYEQGMQQFQTVLINYRDGKINSWVARRTIKNLIDALYHQEIFQRRVDGRLACGDKCKIWADLKALKWQLFDQIKAARAEARASR